MLKKELNISPSVLFVVAPFFLFFTIGLVPWFYVRVEDPDQLRSGTFSQIQVQDPD